MWNTCNMRNAKFQNYTELMQLLLLDSCGIQVALWQLRETHCIFLSFRIIILACGAIIVRTFGIRLFWNVLNAEFITAMPERLLVRSDRCCVASVGNNSVYTLLAKQPRASSKCLSANRPMSGRESPGAQYIELK